MTGDGLRRWGWVAVAVVLLAAGVVFVVRATGGSSDESQAVKPTTTTTTTAARTGVDDPTPDVATKVVNVVAVDAQGNPAAGYAVEPWSAVDGCFASSVAVSADIVACSPTASGTDVCWVAPDRVTLLCGDTPWVKSLRRATSTQPVERVEAYPNSYPWGLELADGTRCRARNGGSWGGRADGYVGYYSCEGRESVVLAPPDGSGPVDRSRPAWTVPMGDIGNDNPEFPAPVRVRVATAYFAA